MMMKSLVTDFVHTGRFRDPAAYQRFGYSCAAILLVSAGVHLAVFAVDGGSWQGPVSWRKPILFGFSFGVTLATLTWFLTFLRPRRVTGWLFVGVLGLASVGEVFLVTMQRWRGVPSHFNEDTPFDAAVFSIMGALVSVIVVALVLLTVRAFMRVDAPMNLAWAIRIGLVLLLVSQAVGVNMIVEGGNTFGAAGAMKLPHAFTLHSIQVLPALALLLSMSPLPESRRLRVVLLGAVGYTLMIASTLVQTYGGRSPLDVNPAAAAFALVGLALLVGCGVFALRALGFGPRHRPRLHPTGTV